MNHQALIERSHKQAVDKGFWEQPLTFDMAMALIISEIAEALEAYRKGRVNPDPTSIPAIKESFEVEISDAIIRIFDWCGRHGYEIEVEPITVYWFKDNEGFNFMKLFHTFSDYWVDSGNKETTFDYLFNYLLSYAQHHNIDIEKYIMWKLDYNLSRPYKHGKQF